MGINGENINNQIYSYDTIIVVAFCENDQQKALDEIAEESGEKKGFKLIYVKKTECMVSSLQKNVPNCSLRTADNSKERSSSICDNQ